MSKADYGGHPFVDVWRGITWRLVCSGHWRPHTGMSGPGSVRGTWSWLLAHVEGPPCRHPFVDVWRGISRGSSPVVLPPYPGETWAAPSQGHLKLGAPPCRPSSATLRWIRKSRRLRDKIILPRIGANLRTNSIRNCQKAGFTERLVYSFESTPISFFTGALKISGGTVFTIVHESLGMHKLFSKCVSRFLTPDQKQQQVKDSERCLELFKLGKKDFLHWYVPMDETWIYHYTPEGKRSSAEFTGAGESCPARLKTQQGAGKVMASVFWDAQIIVFIDYLEKGKNINSDYYMALLDRLSAEIKKKRPHVQKKKVPFHQDNAPCHKSMKTMVTLN